VVLENQQLLMLWKNGFSDNDHVENIRRFGEVSGLFVDAGLIIISAFISPFTNDRKMVREMFSLMTLLRSI